MSGRSWDGVAKEFADKVLHGRITVSAGHDDTDEDLDYSADETATLLVDYAAIALATYRRRNRIEPTLPPTELPAEDLVKMGQAIANAVLIASGQQHLADRRARDAVTIERFTRK